MAFGNKEQATVDLVINGQQAKTSLREVTGAVNSMRAELSKMKATDPGYTKMKSDLQALLPLQKAMREELNGIQKEQQKFSTSWKDIAKGIVAGGAFSAGIGMLKSIGEQVVKTYTEFEKYNAVLTNALGDAGSAKRAMNNLQQFAKETPFQLSEVTESYVKFVNRGIVPTMADMRKMGDLAASQGKSFDQLTEAILDAGTGEFERLKEFGIRASKNGDMVALSFKGVTKEVKYTEEAIQDAIQSFGEMDGVMGGMEKTSKTLGGQISNLGDAWDQLLVTIGSKTGGVLFDAVQSIGGYLNWLTEAMKSTEQRVSESADKMAQGDLKVFNESSKAEQNNIYAGTKSGIEFYKRQRAQAADRGDQSAVDDYTLDIMRSQSFIDAVDAQRKQADDNERKRKAEQRRKDAEENRKEAEKQQKEAEKKAEQRRKQFEKEHADLKKKAEDIKQQLELSNLEGLDKALAEIEAKYDPLIEKAEKFRDAALEAMLAGSKQGEIEAANKKFGKLNEAQRAKDNESQYSAAAQRTNGFFDSMQTDAQNAGASAYEGASTDEQRLQVKEGMANMELELERKRYETLRNLALENGQSTVEIDKQIADNRIAIAERMAQVQKNSAEGERMILDARYQHAQLVTEGLGNLVGIFLGQSKAGVIAQKGITLAQIGIDTAKAISSLTANSEANPNNAWTFGGAGAIQFASGLVRITANMLSAKNLLFGNGSKSPTDSSQPQTPAPVGRSYGDGGMLPDGPLHRDGGLKLVDPNGNVKGEIEGGEPILSRKTYQNNKAILNQLLFASMYRNGASVAVNSAGIMKGSRMERGGFTGSQSVPVVNVEAPNVNMDNAEVLAELKATREELARITKIPVVFSRRLDEEERARVAKVRDEVDA